MFTNFLIFNKRLQTHAGMQEYDILTGLESWAQYSLLYNDLCLYFSDIAIMEKSELECRVNSLLQQKVGTVYCG
jgi:hypothetical protein